MPFTARFAATISSCLLSLAACAPKVVEEAPTVEPVVEEEEPEAPLIGTEAVPSPDAAKELAEAAAEAQLDPKFTWRTSPVLPVSWPPQDKAVMVLMFPMAANPQHMDHFQVYSATLRVRVGLEDGSTTVESLGKRRALGAIIEGRPSVLERRELELAENAMFRYLLAGEEERVEDGFWGYRKYLHEHPEFAREIERRSPEFVRWLKGRG